MKKIKIVSIKASNVPQSTYQESIEHYERLVEKGIAFKGLTDHIFHNGDLGVSYRVDLDKIADEKESGRKKVFINKKKIKKNASKS